MPTPKRRQRLVDACDAISPVGPAVAYEAQIYSLYKQQGRLGLSALGDGEQCGVRHCTAPIGDATSQTMYLRGEMPGTLPDALMDDKLR